MGVRRLESWVEMAGKGAMAHGRMRDDEKMCVLRISQLQVPDKGWAGAPVVQWVTRDDLLSRGVARTAGKGRSA